MKKLIIFDLDGTLLNTIDDLGVACNYALKKHGYPQHELNSYRQMVGNGIRNLVKRAAPTDASDEEREEILRDFMKYYDTHCMVLTEPYQGIMEVLGRTKEKGIKLAVCSNKYQKAVNRIIDHYFPGVFASVYGEREGIPRKPSPEAVYRIMEEMGVKKEETIMVGDSEVDIETARNAGIDSIAVAWGFRSKEQLESVNPPKLVSNTSQLFKALNQ